MGRLPLLSGRVVAQAFVTLGWTVARHGNHIILVRDGSNVSLSVPDHKEVARGTLRSLIRDAGVGVDEFLAAVP